MAIKKFLKLFAPAAALFGLGTPALAEEVAFDRGDADPALWLVQDEDTKIYLFGTMHALKPDLVWFDDAVAAAFAESDELVLEMLEPDEMEIGPVLQREAMYEADGGLSKVLTQEQYARFAAAATSLRIPPQAFERLKPWYAGVMMATAPLARLGYRPDIGAEQILQTAAAERGMKQVGLETFAQQMGFFSNLPEEDQISFLMSGVDELSDMDKTFSDMERAWATGDTAETARLLNEGMDDTPVVYDVLLAKRNAAWADWIGTRMEQPGTVFIAVGAGHLAGDDSVQVRLAEKGLTATRIEY